MAAVAEVAVAPVVAAVPAEVVVAEVAEAEAAVAEAAVAVAVVEAEVAALAEAVAPVRDRGQGRFAMLCPTPRQRRPPPKQAPP